MGWLFLLAALWWILASPRLDGWWAGAVAVTVGIGFHAALGGRQAQRVRIGRLLAFLPWFMQQSVRGGVDVALRAFSPALPLEPGFIRHRIRLAEGPAQIFFVNCISLLPGTFSAELDGTALTVHHLAEPEAAPMRLAELESRVASLFGLDLTRGESSEETDLKRGPTDGSDVDSFTNPRPGGR